MSNERDVMVDDIAQKMRDEELPFTLAMVVMIDTRTGDARAFWSSSDARLIDPTVAKQVGIEVMNQMAQRMESVPLASHRVGGKETVQ